jgi:hypothetical protein
MEIFLLMRIYKEGVLGVGRLYSWKNGISVGSQALSIPTPHPSSPKYDTKNLKKHESA